MNNRLQPSISKWFKNIPASFQKTKQGGSTLKEFTQVPGQVRSRKTPVSAKSQWLFHLLLFSMLWVARRKAHNGRGDIRAGNEPKQVSWSYFLAQEQGRVFYQNPLALPIEDSGKKRPDKDPWQTIFTFCSSARLQERAQQSLLKAPPIWGLSYPYSAVVEDTGSHWAAARPQSHAGDTAALLTWGALCPTDHFGSPHLFSRSVEPLKCTF